MESSEPKLQVADLIIDFYQRGLWNERKAIRMILQIIELDNKQFAENQDARAATIFN